MWRRYASTSSRGRSSTDWSRLSTCFQRSESIISPACQFAVEPGFGRAPIAHYRDGGNFEHFRRLVYAQPAEEPHFHYLRLARVELREGIHRLIEQHQVGIPVPADSDRVIEGNVAHVSAALAVMAAGMLHQDSPHQLGRDGEEMRPVLPVH